MTRRFSHLEILEQIARRRLVEIRRFHLRLRDPARVRDLVLLLESELSEVS